MRPTVRATLVSIGLAAVLFGQDAMACPSCGASASAKGPDIWPIIGLFMLVPWILAGAVAILVRRESKSFFGVRKNGRAALAGVLSFSRTRGSRPA